MPASFNRRNVALGALGVVALLFLLSGQTGIMADSMSNRADAPFATPPTDTASGIIAEIRSLAGAQPAPSTWRKEGQFIGDNQIDDQGVLWVYVGPQAWVQCADAQNFIVGTSQFDQGKVKEVCQWP